MSYAKLRDAKVFIERYNQGYSKYAHTVKSGNDIIWTNRGKVDSAGHELI